MTNSMSTDTGSGKVHAIPLTKLTRYKPDNKNKVIRLLSLEIDRRKVHAIPLTKAYKGVAVDINPITNKVNTVAAD